MMVDGINALIQSLDDFSVHDLDEGQRRYLSCECRNSKDGNEHMLGFDEKGVAYCKNNHFDECDRANIRVYVDLGKGHKGIHWLCDKFHDGREVERFYVK